MELNITNEVQNPVLERKEIEFEINTVVTPSREEIKRKLAALKNAKEELIVIKYIKQLFGEHRAVGKAHVYKSAEMLKRAEPKYLFGRGKKKEKSMEAQKTEK
ncbi:MAG: 30S ribosomal protein S24e [Candidatus Diapherotrites archaeon]|uniref:Small ribosomal subunit protein eS24 n=1 Tax=Candidatus Iainarchaeum sp. TaxID=3101447 RepID=A0A497JKA0_9ARCH|nr:30S ribosomal protein S24e [Candidatus Diapherotrites archaeon]RLG70436.1 MAG: 30S ribosomal protein S24e [Candidatus Diapherotrites archaeon]